LHGYVRQLPLTWLISICTGLKCQEKVVSGIACGIIPELVHSEFIAPLSGTIAPVMGTHINYFFA
jgi:hypothetical protein